MNPRDSLGESLANDAYRGHLHLDLPPGYNFSPDNQLMLTLLNLFNMNADNISACPVHYTHDSYALPPAILASKFPKGNHNSWYLLSTKRYPTTGRQDRHVAGGFWRRKGRLQKIENGAVALGMKLHFEFYTSEGIKTEWRLDEFSLIEIRKKCENTEKEIDFILCRIYYEGEHQPKTVQHKRARSVSHQLQHQRQPQRQRSSFPHQRLQHQDHSLNAQHGPNQQYVTDQPRHQPHPPNQPQHQRPSFHLPDPQLQPQHQDHSLNAQLDPTQQYRIDQPQQSSGLLLPDPSLMDQHQ